MGLAAMSSVNLFASNEQPSERINSEGNPMPTDRYKTAGNFSSANTEPRAFRLTQKEWRQLSRGAFREHTKGLQKPAHVLADEVHCNPKTAQSWLDGDSTPAGILDLRAMATIPAYAALKREIAAMETDMDPRLQAKYAELHRLTLELADGKGMR
jgi:hypothetical protein